MFATLSKINDWFETFRHAEGRMDFLWTFKVPKYNIIVDAKAGLLNRAIQIVLVVFVIVIPMSRGTGLEATVPLLNQKLHICFRIFRCFSRGVFLLLLELPLEIGVFFRVGFVFFLVFVLCNLRDFRVFPSAKAL